ncbi:MAG: hypothetical protein QGH25_09850 [Candidatus Latescibacteria bacterium]|jgi:hypothetical protein|nr:hypothetical protein [Candidatus Latescibacterota bacterium]
MKTLGVAPIDVYKREGNLHALGAVSDDALGLIPLTPHHAMCSEGGAVAGR